VNSLETYLNENPIFSTLNAEDKRLILTQAIPRSYRKGEWVVQYGDVWAYLFWVEKGAVTALKESCEGRTLVIETILDGEIFWGTSFFQVDAPMPVSLRAEEDTDLFLWPAETLKPIFFRNGKISWELARRMVQRMLRASEVVEELAFRPISGRLARLLLTRYSGSDGPVARDLTLDEMAARVGSTREIVCRVLYRLADEGMIQISRTEFFLTDEEGLQELALKSKG
jgi:CRP/FNR family transcriptional regulator